MKNLTTILIVLFTTISTHISSQNLDTASAVTLYDSLDSTRITTKILIDKVLAAGPNFYKSDGKDSESPVLDALSTLDNIWLLRQGAVQDTQVPPVLDLIDSSHSFVRLTGNYPIFLADFDYNRIDSLVFLDSLLTYRAGEIVDGPNLNTSPYSTQRFINAAILDSFYLNSANFVLDSSFYFSNSGFPEIIEIDFGDGQGFQTLTFGQVISPSYNEYTPNFNGKKALIKIRLKKNGKWADISFSTQIIQCSGNINIPTPVSAPWPNGNNFRFGNINAIPFDQSPIVEGNAYIHFRPNPGIGEEALFKKPVIIVEGFETGEYDPNKAENYRMGDLGWCQLWGSPYGVLNESPLQNASTLFTQLHNDGYDIIMLDFKDSKRSLINNAALLRELITKVNQFKTPDADPNIIIGASAGGLISRYALAYMERENENHCSSLWISLDAPHKGANISLGAQYMLHFLATNDVQAVTSAKIMLKALKSKAAKELLIYNIYQRNKSYFPSSQSGYVQTLIGEVSGNHLTFRDKLDQIGFPQKPYSIAVASGSRTMKDQGFPSITKLYSLNAAFNGWHSGVYIDGNVSLDYWDAGGVYSSGYIGYTAHPWYLAFAPVISNSDSRIFRNPSNIRSIDRVPGGIRKLAPEIKETVRQTSLGGYNFNIGSNDAHQQDQCFVPTVSALNINSTNYFFNVEAKLVTNQLPTPFDEVYLPINNTNHVSLTNGSNFNAGDNIYFITNKINQSAPVAANNLNNHFNHAEGGVVTFKEINSNGALYLYGDFIDSRSGTTVSSGNMHKYTLNSKCDNNQLRIKSGGELILGNSIKENKAEFIIPPDATLIVDAGGKITINNGSKLTLKKGSNLIIKAGNVVTLEGPNSELLIQGKLTLKQDASLSINNGKLIFDQDIPWITDPNNGNSVRDIASYLDIEPGAKLRLIGANPSLKNQTLLEIRRETIFKDAEQDIFDEVIVQNGAIEFAPQAFLFVASPINIIDSEIRGTNSQAYHGGLRIWNNSTINYLRRVTIKNGAPGVLVSGLGSMGHTEFRDCSIENNWDGLKWNGGFHKVLNCSFSNNIRHAIYGLNLNGTSEVYNSNFSFTPLNNISASGSALELQGQEGSLLQVGNTTIDGFATGINLNDIDLRAECNTIKNNLIGIKSNNAMLYLNDNASNTIKNNESAGINLIGSEERGSGIYLLEGNNKFQIPLTNLASYNHVLGLWDCYQPLSDYTANMYFDFNYNNFEIPSSSTNGSLFSLSLVSCSNPSLYQALNVDLSINNSSSLSCGGTNNEDLHPSLATLSELPPTFGKVTGGVIFNETPLNLAISQALGKLSFGENIRNDKEGLHDLISILNGTITESDNSTQAYLNLAYKAMHQALNQVYQANQLSHNEGEPNPPVQELTDITSVIDDLLLPLDNLDSLDHSSIFQLNLDKVHAFRLAGHYNEAKAILANRANWTFNFTQSQRASYWNCVCEQEANYYSEEIPAEEFDYGLDLCRQTYVGYTYKKETQMVEIKAKLDQAQLKVYPQPVKSLLFIETNPKTEGELNISIFSLSGQVLSQSSVNPKEGKFEIDMQNLSSGVYLVRFSNAHINESIRVLKD